MAVRLSQRQLLGSVMNQPFHLHLLLRDTAVSMLTDLSHSTQLGGEKSVPTIAYVLVALHVHIWTEVQLRQILVPEPSHSDQI